MDKKEVVSVIYGAYNQRELERGLACLAEDVEWDDGEGHLLPGKSAVADHWRAQWRKADAQVFIESVVVRGDELQLAVRLSTARPDGSRESQALRNVIGFRGALVRSMRIA